MTDKYCATCKHFTGCGDWDLCCDLPHPESPFGFLCYGDTPACERYEERKPKIDCKKCKLFDSCEMPESMGYMNGGCRAYTEKPKTTNEDLIRAKTDKELAGYLLYYVQCQKCAFYGLCCCKNKACFEKMLKWLKSDANRTDKFSNNANIATK